MVRSPPDSWVGTQRRVSVAFPRGTAADGNTRHVYYAPYSLFRLPTIVAMASQVWRRFLTGPSARRSTASWNRRRRATP